MTVKKASIPVSVSILDKEYLISCPPQERDGLLRAAGFLSERMRDVRDNGRLAGLDRIAVMAALHIAHEFIQIRERGESKTDLELLAQIRRLSDKVEAAVISSRQLEL